jgi:hypothetical protein
VVHNCELVGCNNNSKVMFACLSNVVESGRGLFTALLWNLTGRDNSKIVRTSCLLGQGLVLRSSFC